MAHDLTDGGSRNLLGDFLVLGGALAAAAAPALAGPEGAQVARGNVKIDRNGDLTTIRASDRSIINYRGFDIAGHETVRFIQPSASSKVLNRINSPRPTRIDGSLFANGHVYLVNPSGVLFSKGAMIDVGGMHAAAANITDANFIRGVDRFTDARGLVANEGSIRARRTVQLIGQQVFNSGSISAPEGTVIFASGDEVFVGPASGSVFVKVDNAAAAPAPTGEAKAAAGRVASGLGAGDVYSLAIGNTGTVRASNIKVESARPGKVVAVGGTLDASDRSRGGEGGRVEVLGDRVMVSDATIDASGEAAGGTVLVGGSFQGKGEQRNAQRTVVDGGSTLRADATGEGDGGRIIVWADGRTDYAGHASVRGGPRGGDGGFVEVSGKGTLGYAGTVDALAPGGGRVGDLLLDPTNIFVVATGDADAITLADVNQFGDPDAAGGASRIDVALIEAAAANVILQASTDITFSVPVTMSNNGVGITAQAGDDIIVNSAITTRGGDITLIANDSASGAATGDGAIELNAALSTAGNTQTGGDITLTTTGSSRGAELAANLTTDQGAVTVNGSTLLKADVTIDTKPSGNGVAGAVTLGAVSADAAGHDLAIDTKRESGNVNGANVSLGAFDASGGALVNSLTITSAPGGGGSIAGTTTLNGPIATAGNVDIDALVTIAAPLEIDAATGTITFRRETNAQANALVLTADEIDLLTGAGNLTGTSSLTLRPSTDNVSISVGDAAAGTLDLNATDLAAIDGTFSDITIGRGGGTALTTIGDATFGMPVAFLQGGAAGQIALTATAALATNNDAAITLTAGTGDTGSFTKPDGATIDSGAGDLTITADSVSLGTAADEITSTGQIVLQPASPGRPIVIGAAGAATDFALDAAELAALTDGSSEITIGRAGGTHAVTVNASTFRDSTTIRADGLGGAISVAGAITGTGASDITFDGDTTLAANITTANGGDVTVTGATTLAADAVIDTDAAANGDIDLQSTVAGGGNDLDLLASGTVDVGGAATGLTTLDATGSTIAVNAVTTTGNQSYTGATTTGGALATTTDGSVTVTGAATLGGNITTAGGGDVIVTGIATLTADRIIDTDAAATGNIALGGVAGGANDLDLLASGTVAITGAATGLTTLDATGSSVTVDAVTTTGNQTYTGPTTTTGTLSTTTNGNVLVTGGASLGGNIATAGGGDVTITGAVALTTNAGITAGGTGGNILLGAGATGAGRTLALTAAGDSVTVTTASSLGSLSAQGATINVASVTTTGNQTYTGATTTGGALTTTTNGDITINGSANLGGDITTAGGGDIEITGATTFAADRILDADGDLGLASVNGGGNNLDLLAGGAITVSGAATNLVTLDATAADITVDAVTTTGDQNYTGATATTGALATTAAGSVTVTGTADLGGDITTAGGGDVSTSNIATLSADVVIDTDAAANGAITLGGVDGDGNDLTLDASGAVTLTGAATDLASLTAAGSSISVTTVVSSGNQSYTGPTTTTNTLATTGNGNVTITGAATLGGNITTAGGGDVSISGLTTLNAVTVRIDTDAAANGNIALAGIAGGGNNVDLLASGTAAVGGAAADLATFDAAGSAISVTTVTTTGNQTYTGPTTASGALTTTTNGSITVTGAATLGGDLTTAGGGDVTITGVATLAADRIIDTNAAANGNIALGGVAGGANDLDLLASGTVAVTGAAANLATLDATGSSIAVDAVTTTGDQTYSGPTTTSGALTTTTNGNVTVTGTASLGGDITTAGGGDVSISNTATLTSDVVIDTDAAPGGNIALAGALGGGARGLTLDASGAVVLSGAATGLTSLTAEGSSISVTTVSSVGDQTYTGPTTTSNTLVTTTNGDVTINGTATLGGNVITAGGGDVTVTGPTTLASNVTIDTDAAAGGDIDFQSTVTGATRNLALLASGTNSIGGAANLAQLTATGSSISAAAVTTTGNQTYTGATTANGALTTTTNGDVTINGTATLGGNITTAGGGDVTVTGPATLAANVTIDADAAADGDITLGSTVSGAGRALTLLASDSVAIGGAADLASLTASGATIGVNAVTTTGNQTYTGATTTTGALATTTSGNVTINGAATLGGDITTAGGGTVALGGDVTLNGAARAITTDSASDGAISIAGAVDGPSALTLDAGSAAVSVGGAIGATTPPASFTAEGSTISVTAVTTAGDQSYTGATTSTGDLTTASGSVTIDGTANLGGAIVLGTGGSLTIDGAATLGGTVSTTGGGDVTVTGLTTLASDTVIDTDAAPDGNIALGGVAGEGNNLDLLASGTVAINGAAANLASLDAAGSAVNVAAVTTTGDQTYAGLTTATGALTTTLDGDVTITGPAALTGVTTAGGGSVTITGTAVLGGDITTAGGGDVLIGGFTAVDATTVRIDTDAAPEGNITLGGGVAGGGNNLDLLASGTVAIGGAVADLDTLDATGSSISVTSVTTTRHQNYTGPTTATGALTTTTTGNVRINGAATLGGDVTTAGGGDVTITGIATLTADRIIDTDAAPDGSIALGGVAGGGNDLDLLASGTVAINGAAANLATLDATGSGITVDAVTTTGRQTYNGPTTIGGDLTSSAGGVIRIAGDATLTGDAVTVQTAGGAADDIIFDGSINGGTVLTLNAGAADATFGAAIGGDTALAGLNVTAAAIDLPSVRTTGGQSYTGTVGLHDDLTSTTSGVIAVNGNATLHDDLTIRAAGNDAADGVTFAGLLNSDAANTPRALTVVGGTGGTVQFGGAVGGQARLRSLEVTADPDSTDVVNVGQVRVGSDIRTVDGIVLGGPVILTGTSTVESAEADIFFRGTLDGSGDGTPEGLTILTRADDAAAAVEIPQILLRGSIGADEPLAYVHLNFVPAGGNRRPNVPLVATVGFSDAFNADGVIPADALDTDREFVVATTGDFIMGRREKLTVFGTLTVEAGGKAALGDITAAGDINVTAAGPIELRRREKSNILDNEGRTIGTADLGVDYVADGRINFNKTPVEVDVGDPATFATSGGVRSQPDNLVGFPFRAFVEGVGADLFTVGGFIEVLDLRSLGPSDTNVANAIAGAIPTAETGSVTTPSTVGANLRKDLAEIGVYVKDLTPAEVESMLDGVGVFNDVPAKSNPRAGDRDYEVTSRRVPRRLAAEVVQQHRSLVYSEVLDESGRPVLDAETGEPRREDRRDQVRDALGRAWEAYAAQDGEADPAAFRTFVQSNPEHAEALAFLDQLGALFRNLRGLGLSPVELEISRMAVLDRITPEEKGMTDHLLAEAAENRPPLAPPAAPAATNEAEQGG